MSTNPNPFLRSPFDTIAEDEERAAAEQALNLPGQQATIAPLEIPEMQAAPSEPSAPAVPSMRKPGKSAGLLPPPEFEPLFIEAARKHGVPVNVLMAIGQQESSYNPGAQGMPTKWGIAKGMMQYLPGTAKGLGIDANDPAQAIDGAARQIRERLDAGMKMKDAIKEHFAGPDRAQWGPKTDAYGEEVMGKVREIGRALTKAAPTASGKAAPNAMGTAQSRADYQATFMANNPQARPEAVKMAMDQYDTEAKARAAATPVQDKFAQMLDPNATFDARLDAKLAARQKNKSVVPGMPSVAQPVADPMAPTDAPGLLNDVQRGARNLQATGYGLAALAADATGYDEAADQMLARYVETTNNNLRDNPAAIGSYKNVETLGDAGRYAVEAVLENAAMIIPSLVTGGIGAMAARKGAEKIVGGMISQQVAKGVAKEVAERNALAFIARRATMGAVAGAVPASVGMEAGSIMGDTFAETGEKASGAALAYGIPAGLLDSIGPVMALRKIAGPVVDEVAGHVIKRLGVEVGKQFLAEAGTEGLQTILETAAVRSVDGKALFNADLLDQVIDASLKGGIGGAVMGGASQAVSEIRSPRVAAPIPAEAAPKPAADAPLTAAIADSAQAAPRVVVATPEAQIAGELQGYTEDEAGRFTAQVLDDDGNVVTISDDGVTEIIPVELEAGPLSSALGDVATGMPDIPELTDVMAPADDIPELNDVVEAPAVQPVEAQDDARRADGRSDSDVRVLDVGRGRDAGDDRSGTADPIGGGADAAVRGQRRTAAGSAGATGPDGDVVGGDTADTIAPLKPGRARADWQDKVDKREAKLAEQISTAKANTARRNMTGKKIDAEWSSFAPRTGTLNIDRAEMPQVKAEHRGALVNFLNARGIAHAQEEVAADSLKPTQREFSPAKIEKAKAFVGGDRSILVSSDNHVLDGHHQWMAKMEQGEQVKVIRLDAPISQLLADVKEFPSVEESGGATAPASAAQESEPQATTKQPETVAAKVPEVAPKSVALEAARAEMVATLADMPTAKLRDVAANHKRAYMRNAATELLAQKEDASRAKRSNAMKQRMKREKRINPDTDTMLQAIAKMGGINRESARGRFRFAPEEMNVKAKVGNLARHVFVTEGGMRVDQAGAAMADLGYVGMDENGKHDQSDWEDLLARAAGGEEVYTAQGMIARAEVARAMEMEELQAKSDAEMAEIEGFADDLMDWADDNDIVLPDAPDLYLDQNDQPLITDEEIDAYFNDRQEEDAGAENQTDSQGQARASAGTDPDAQFLQAQTRSDLEAKDARANDQAVADRELADSQRGAFSLSAPAGSVTGEANAMSNTRQNAMFSVKGNADRDLVITHNLTEENLLHANKMGGIAVPSLAVTKKDSPLAGFGEITLIGSRAMADPKGYAKTQVFGADIYSPRYPSVERDLDTKGRAALEKKFRPMADKMSTGLPETEELQRKADEALARSPAVMATFLSENGIAPDITFLKGIDAKREARLREFGLGPYIGKTDSWDLRQDDGFRAAALAEIIDTYEQLDGKRAALINKLRTDQDTQDNFVRGIADEIAKDGKLRKRPELDTYATRSAIEKQIEAAGLDNSFKQYVADQVESITKTERIFQGFTNSGNRKYIPHTLENVVKILKKDLRGGENFNYGVGSLRAHFTPQFKSVADIQKNKDRLVSKAQFEAVKKDIDDEFFALKRAMSEEDLSINDDTLVAVLEDAPRMGIDRAAAKYAVVLTDDARKKANTFLDKLAHLPTEYFEAKIVRDVDLAEFSGAVIPKNASNRVRKLLESRGVPFTEYGSEAERAAAIDRFSQELDASKGDVLFSTGTKPGTLTPESLRKSITTGTLGPVVDSMVESGLIVLHADASTLPTKKAPKAVQALTTPDGKVHLVASNLNGANARAVMLHEAFHQGGQSLIGTTQWDNLIRQLGSMYRQGKGTSGAANKFWKAAKARVDQARAQGAVGTDMEAEEFAAYAIEEYESAPPTVKKWVDDLIGMVKAWLVKRFGKQFGTITPAQLLAMAKMALYDAASTRKPALFELAGEFFSTNGRTIEVDGVRRPIENSKGQLVALDFAGQKKFWEWFGSSAVTDERGRPLVVYHGTANDVAEFQPERAGQNSDGKWNWGLFFTNNNIHKATGHIDPEIGQKVLHDVASTTYFAKASSAGRSGADAGGIAYPGANVMPVYASLEKPLVIEKTGRLTAVEYFDKHSEAIRKKVETGGHDGVIIKDAVNDIDGAPETLVVALRPEQIKSATGNAGTFDPANPDIRYSVASTAPGAQAQTQTQAQADEVAEATGLTPPPQGFLRKVQAAVQDNMNRLKQTQEHIEKITGVALKESMDAYGAFANRPGRVAARIEDGELHLFEPLMKRLAKAGHTMDQLADLLHAMHAKERNKHIRSIDPTRHDGSGMSDKHADEILKQYADDGFTSLHKLADDARAINRAVLQMKLDYGLIEQEDFDHLTTFYQHYVPLKGGDRNEDGTKRRGVGAAIKRAMGHSSRDEHILENIQRDFKMAVSVGERNLAKMSLLRLMLANPDAKLWTVGVPPKGRRVVKENGFYVVYKDGMKIARFDSAVEAERQSELYGVMDRGRVHDYSVEPAKGSRLQEFVKPLQENEDVVMIKGRPVRFQINDQALAKQLMPMTKDELNMLHQLAQWANRQWSKMFTGYNPTFIFTNLARDVQTGTLNMVGNYGAITAGRTWAKHYAPSLGGLIYWAATGKLPKGKLGVMLNEYRMHGGKVGASHIGNLDDAGKSLQTIFDNAKGVTGFAAEGRIGKASWMAARKSVRALARVIEIINQGTENALRLALYTEMRDQGATPGRAAQAAKSVTVDFDRRGASTSALSAAYLFFNPAVQGTANATKTIFKGKHKAQALAALGGYAMLGFYIASLGMDQDDDKWLGAEWDERTKFLLLNVGERQIRIPLSQEFAPFYAMGVAMAETSRGEKGSTSAIRLLSSVIDAYVPLRNVFVPDSDNPGADIGMALLPTLAQVPVQVAANRNAFGSELMPESDFTKDRPDNLKMNKGTKNTMYDKAAQGIAAAGVAAGIGGKYENDITKISPETLKLIWANLTGGVGTFVADSLGVASQGMDDNGEVDLTNFPITKSFVREPGAKPLRGRYYDLTREARKAISEFEAAKKAGDFDEVAAIRDNEDKDRLIRLAKVIKANGKAAGAKRDEMVDINSDASLTPGQKRAALKELDKEEQELYRDAIEAFKN